MAKYRDAVRWIARNDDPGETDAETVQFNVTVGLVADVFGKACLDVARDVVTARTGVGA